MRPQGKRKGSMIFINIIKYFLDSEEREYNQGEKILIFSYLHNVSKKEMSNHSGNGFVCRGKILGLIGLSCTVLSRARYLANLAKFTDNLAEFSQLILLMPCFSHSFCKLMMKNKGMDFHTIKLLLASVLKEL